MQQTTKALMRRGIDSEVAQKIAKQKITLGALKTFTEGELIALGLTPDQASAILSEKRPPIPQSVFNEVLFANRSCCCICRDPRQPIILHHIRSWSESHDHSAQNLAVLCLHHHDEAHTKRELSLSLSASTIRKHKKEWEKTVKALDARAIAQASERQSTSWYYYNVERIFEFTENLNIDFSSVASFERGKQLGLINENGRPVLSKQSASTLYDHQHGFVAAQYMKRLLERLLKSIDVINISDFLDQAQIKYMARPGDVIFVQGAHNFRKENSIREGRGQVRTGSREANRVRIEFVFDGFEAISTSAWSCWLSGRQSAASLCHVKSQEMIDGKLVVRCTALAIGFALPEQKTREYASQTLGYAIYNSQSDIDETEDDWLE